jgi:chromosome segregation ATPase
MERRGSTPENVARSVRFGILLLCDYAENRCVCRLIDLVKAKDSIYRPAFYFALQDTLVAKDLDQAVRYDPTCVNIDLRSKDL